jgi:hypothetical protein
MTDPCNDPKTFAPVLQRMVEILGAESSERVTFGDAMTQASRELNIPVPDHMVAPLLTSAFKVIGSGRIPGAPDA